MAGGLLATAVTAAPAAMAAAAAGSCAAATNPIVCENAKPGTPKSEWDNIGDGAGDDSIQGFATDMSVNVGTTESFKVKATAAYTMDIYRLGYYQGNGARLITSLTPAARTQPACLSDNTTHLLDCGNWAVSASWAVPSDAVSGVYLAKITRTDTGGASQIPFIVRNDASTSDVYFQTSDTTWQAYNNYGGDQYFDGGANFYGGTGYNSSNRAYKLSYNRPFATRGWENGRDYLFANEFPMIKFLEQNGYNVSYSSGIDTSRYGSLLKNHKVFLTAGHDEYWDTVQRKNVQSARDAGVNLAFFTGNDMYWKTRYEDSTDGSSTPYRTLTSYKETWSNAKIDPSSQWTGTWRDPRFSPPADGGQPENGLSGTLFMSNSTDLPITVSATEAKLRIWRNTSLTSMTGTQTTALAAHTAGYETNEDVDNGFRPAGLIDMSTVTGASSAVLKDYGTVTGAGTTTHHITLYKASSGALVFSAGSIQWAWGLDSDHDGNGAAADVRIQQATVNLLADMGAQPQTLMSSLTAASASADTVAPASAITKPATGSAIANGTQVTVTGTASDTGGGVVGGVEVSLDGGSTWHPATGRTSWTYTGVLHGLGDVAIRSRATDDSGNIETPSAGSTITQNCPCSLFGSAVPATADAADTSDVELGVKFTPTVNGVITGVRFYKAAGNTGTHTGTLWSSAGGRLATGTFADETATGWQTLTFTTPVSVKNGTIYVVSYRAPKGHYAADTNFFSVQDWAAGPLTGLRGTTDSGNGVYANGGSFPNSAYHNENYYVDAVYNESSSVAPIVSGSSPRNAQTGVATSSALTATLSGSVVSGSAAITVKDSSGTSVAGATTYDDNSQTVTFTASSPLAVSTTYTVTISDAKTSKGVTMTPVSSAFTTDSVATCPCSLFGTTSTPGTADAADGSAVELGTRFTPGISGLVTGVRFYKAAANTGPHTGSLWAADGTRLATGTFTNETASGWQTLTFATPVTVTAGTTYTASYLAPAGHYSADSGFFTSAYTSGYLTAPAAANGVYAYGNGGVAPASSFGSTNYWVDPLLVPGNVAPAVTTTDPASGATGASPRSTLSATFSVPVQSASVQFSLTGPNSAAVAGSVQVSGASATFTPSAALAAGTTYTASISGAQNSSGTAMASAYTWSFTTASAAACPCSLFPSTATPATIDSGDTAAIQLGVRITPEVDGFITGVKFYKAETNTGTHTGSLWSSTGTQLATGTFSGESASGWQTLTFATAVPVTAGTTYTASYLAPNGHYSVTGSYFLTTYRNGVLTAPATGGNGVYAYGSDATVPASSYQGNNYWVDAVFTGTAPSLTDLALNQPATQSSDAFSAPASRAVDGNTDGVFNNGSVTHTNGDANAWWQVDLGRSSTINSVKVSNRTDCCSDRLNGAVVFIGASNLSARSYADLQADTAVVKLAIGATAPASISLSAGGVTGRYVKVQLPGTNNLSLAEVEVFGTPIMDSTPPVISAVSAAPAGATATITWTTDEASTSVVKYGTSATSLTSTATGTPDVTGHSVNLTGLTAKTPYFYRVTSADAAGNPATAPASSSGAATFTTSDNLALGRNATQSSTAADASRAVDGNTDGVFNNGSVSHTNSDANAWWQVDLGSAQTIRTINVWNRTDCCATRLNNAVVFISTADMSTRTYAQLQADTTVTKLNLGTVAAAKTMLAVPAVSGRYVKVQLSGTDYLHLAEVQVYDTDQTPPVTTAVAASATSNSATINWTTDEASTSVVQYGTSATSLTSTTTGPSNVTAHSVNLTGLTASTPYYYRVTSADAAGNTTTTPATASAAASFGTTANSTNLAQGKTATQSSTAFSAAAARAVDGNTDGVFNNNSVTHTNTDANAWWQVDLGAATPIGTVSIFNRTDCCADRLNGGVVFISASDMSGRTYSVLQSDSTVTKLAIGNLAPASINLNTNPVSGRYIKVQLPGTNNLSLAEVRVYGTPPAITAVSASPASTTATVTWTTDRASTSVIQYGTSATSLSSTVIGASNVTAHSVNLTGLTSGTPYFYRVTSADAAGSTATSPATSDAAASFTTSSNLALGKTVSSSSSLESSPWGQAKVVDGVTTSTSTSAGWTSNSLLTTAHTEYVQVDLGTAQSVRQVSLHPRSDTGNVGAGYPVNFTVSVSTNGSTWTTVNTTTGAAQPTSVQQITFTTASARYVRFTGTSLRQNPNDGNRYRMQLAELGIA